MSQSQSPDLPDTPEVPGSATVVQRGTPPVALIGSALDATSLSPPEPLGGTERYELLNEIARGGMGVVYRARDRALGREVGLKTLLKVPTEGSAIAARFREEARITGQLQHPNIPPVHDLGTLPDGRPFLAMKLIKGRTLDALLKARTNPSAEPGRYLAIFEQIAQGVAYAHAHKVIHRDLKPLNVMVGAFGEVQVMDWGLAKVLTDRAARTVAESEIETGLPTEIRPSRDQSEQTRAGSVLGTPAYMPREQAIGAVDRIDTRSDVFSLGGILCAILTGWPPYMGADAESTRQLAAVAKLDDAFARLDASGAEPELVALSKRCLSAERDDRPRDAEGVAKAVAELRAETERRARQAELDRVRAEGERTKVELRVVEQRKRWRVQMLLAAAVGLLMLSGGAFAWWREHQANERLRIETRLAAEQEFKASQAQQGVTANLKLAADLRAQYKFKAAAMALVQAAESAKGAPERLPEVEQAQRDLAFVVQLDDIRFRKWIYITEPGGGGTFNTKIASPEYRKAFADHGLDLTTLDVAEAVQRIAASNVKADLVAAVDDWALYLPLEDSGLRDRLLEIARKADDGEWTDRLRDPLVWKDKAAVAKLAAEANPTTTPPAALSVLAELMRRNNLDPSALLSLARVQHPTNFELAFALGQWHVNSKDGEQIGPYEAARALRPENVTAWNNLGNALNEKGDREGAIAAYNKAIELDPKLALSHSNLGVALKDKGNLDGAIAAYNKAIELDPKDARVYTNLGAALKHKGNLDGAIAACLKAIELDPKLALAYFNLGVALDDKGDVDGAIAAYKKAIELDPKLAPAHTNLGATYFNQKKYAEAIASARAAIMVDPNFSNAHAILGLALQQTGDISGARAALTEAARLDKRWAAMLAKLPPVAVAPPPREVNR